MLIEQIARGGARRFVVGWWWCAPDKVSRDGMEICSWLTTEWLRINSPPDNCRRSHQLFRLERRRRATGINFIALNYIYIYWYAPIVDIGQFGVRTIYARDDVCCATARWPTCRGGGGCIFMLLSFFVSVYQMTRDVLSRWCRFLAPIKNVCSLGDLQFI